MRSLTKLTSSYSSNRKEELASHWSTWVRTWSSAEHSTAWRRRFTRMRRTEFCQAKTDSWTLFSESRWSLKRETGKSSFIKPFFTSFVVLPFERVKQLSELVLSRKFTTSWLRIKSRNGSIPKPVWRSHFKRELDWLKDLPMIHTVHINVTTCFTFK